MKLNKMQKNKIFKKIKSSSLILDGGNIAMFVEQAEDIYNIIGIDSVEYDLCKKSINVDFCAQPFIDLIDLYNKKPNLNLIACYVPDNTINILGGIKFKNCVLKEHNTKVTLACADNIIHKCYFVAETIEVI